MRKEYLYTANIRVYDIRVLFVIKQVFCVPISNNQEFTDD